MTAYASLRAILDEAYDQAATGKGRDRHAQGQPFERQPICEIARLVGPAFPIGQALKKGQEAMRLPSGRAEAELLGAINYLAAAVIVMRETPHGEAVPEVPHNCDPHFGVPSRPATPSPRKAAMRELSQIAEDLDQPSSGYTEHERGTE